jgi:aminoglycoside phosphotransferase (APT) family kinase protein
MPGLLGAGGMPQTVYTRNMTRPRHHIETTQPEERRRPLDGALEETARAFFPTATQLASIGNGELVRVEAGEATWVVRRWQAGASVGQVRFVHDLMRIVRTAGVEVVPEIATAPNGEAIVSRAGRIYDAQRWLPGAVRARQAPDRGPLGEHVNVPAVLPVAVQQTLIESVARVHLASMPLAQAQGAPSLPLAAMVRAVEGVWERARVRLRPAAPSRPIIQRWIRSGERALRVAANDLLDHPEVSQAVRVVGHHDLWPAHALVSRDEAGGGPRLTGLVDWTDAAAGSPLLDLAQLITHFGGWTAQTAEETIATYSAVFRLEPDERRMLPAVATLDLIAESAWLLSVAYGQPERDQPPSTVLRDGVEEMVESLERAAEVASLGDRPRKPIRRQWVHREPPRSAKGKGGERGTPSAPARDSRQPRRGDGPGPAAPKRTRPPRKD